MNSDTAAFIGSLLVQSDNTAGLGLASSIAGSVPVARGQWNSFDLLLDFQTQTQAAYVNGVFIGQGPFANPATALGSVGLGLGFMAGTDQAAYDNLLITSSTPVPEPSSLALLGLAGAALALHTALFTALKGLVCPDFETCLVDTWPLPQGDPVVGIDWGFHNPFAALWGVHDKDDVLWIGWERWRRLWDSPDPWTILELKKNLNHKGHKEHKGKTE